MISSSQKGFSLVELMVGLTVGLLLLAGITQIYVGNKQNFRAQESLTALQQDARFASFMFDLIIGHAGYRPDAFEDETQALTEAALIGDTGADPDNVRVRSAFVSDGTMVGCLGDTVDDGDQSMNEFYLSPEAGTDTYTLMCDRDVMNPAGTTFVVQNDRQPLINNVRDFAVLYGLDTNGDDSIDIYDDTPADFDDVRTVRVALVLVSDNGVRLTGGTQTVRVFGEDRTYGDADDRRQYRVFERTIALRNRLP